MINAPCVLLGAVITILVRVPLHPTAGVGRPDHVLSGWPTDWWGPDDLHGLSGGAAHEYCRRRTPRRKAERRHAHTRGTWWGLWAVSFACRTVATVLKLSALELPSANVCFLQSDSRSTSSKTRSPPPFASTLSCDFVFHAIFVSKKLPPKWVFTELIKNSNRMVWVKKLFSPSPSVLKPDFHLPRSEAQLLSQSLFLLL